MIITKLGHSCLIVEENGTRILIDPGTYTFMVNPEALRMIKDITAIIVTHEHPDHLDREKLPQILHANSSPPLYTNAVLAEQLQRQGIAAEALQPGATIAVKNLAITAVDCRHGMLPEGPIVAPANIGVLINQKLFHPGDCTLMDAPPQAEILALPAIAPWGSTTQAVAFAKQVRPRLVFPIHDAIMRFPELTNRILQASCEHLGTAYQPLGPGGTLSA